MARTTNNSSVNRLDEGGVLPISTTLDLERLVSHDQRQQQPHHDVPRQRRLLPVPSSLSSADVERDHTNPTAESEGPEPVTPPSPTNRRGRKPSAAMSRSAREAARKSNHSRIEKLRREKINDALASLRELVPTEAASSGGVDDDDDETALRGGGQQKEFKLDILERTVVYLRKLKARVEELEGNEEGRESMDVEGLAVVVKEGGRRCSSKSRIAVDEEAYEDKDDDDDDQASRRSGEQGYHPVTVASTSLNVQNSSRSSSLISRNSSSVPHSSQAQSQSQSVRLPSFSSLLNHSPLHSPRANSSSQYASYSQHSSPNFYPSSSNASASTRPVDFPISPPSSGRLRPYQPSANPPLLHLPSSSFSQSNDLHTLFPPRHMSTSTASTTRPWMVGGPSSSGNGGGAMDLLQCSAERSSLSPEITRRAVAGTDGSAAAEPDKTHSAGVTPASMLGIDHLMRSTGSSASSHAIADDRSTLNE